MGWQATRRGGWWRAALLLVMLAVAAGAAQAQDSYRRLALLEPRPHVYHEAFAWPDGDSVGLAIAFRIPNTQLVFERTPGGFEAVAEVVVRVQRDGEEVVSHTWRVKHREASFAATQDRLRDVQGLVTFELPPGRYTYTVQGGEQTRLQQPAANGEHTATGAEVVLKSFGGTATVGRAILLRGVERSGDTVAAELANLGGAAPFAQAVYALVPVVLPPATAPGTVHVRWRLVKEYGAPTAASSGSEEQLPEEQQMASGTVRGADLVPVSALADLHHEQGTLHWQPPEYLAGYAAVVDFGGERLPDGVYVLEATLEAEADTARADTPFGTHWRDQPVALYHPEVAIEVLRFIADRDVVKQLREGSRQEQEEKLRAFWAQRDPTPSTPFNELMAEYYRRVDYAAQAFRTGVVPGPDGLETDRARIYVTMGPPEDVVRRLPERGGVEETWTYPDGRRFVFRAATSYDAYRLVE